MLRTAAGGSRSHGRRPDRLAPDGQRVREPAERPAKDLSYPERDAPGAIPRAGATPSKGIAICLPHHTGAFPPSACQEKAQGRSA